MSEFDKLTKFQKTILYIFVILAFIASIDYFTFVGDTCIISYERSSNCLLTCIWLWVKVLFGNIIFLIIYGILGYGLAKIIGVDVDSFMESKIFLAPAFILILSFGAPILILWFM